MKQFRDLSISVKLTLLAVVTSLLALVGTRAAFFIIDHRLMKSAMVERYSTMADVFGQNCLPSLEFSDAEDAQSVLSSLQNDPHVCLASLYDEQDFPFASYVRDSDRGTPDRPQREDGQGRFGSDGHLHLVRPVWRDQKLMGRLYLQIDLEEMRSRSWQQLRITSVVLILSLLLAIALAARLQRVISHPVLQLLETAHQVIQNGDYSIRARKESNDELGQLVGKFNKMLTTIEARDAELVQHRENLETLVRERTRDLEQKTEEALAASVAKTLFLANMSHEIRTPMNAILGFANLLRRGEAADKKEEREHLHTICTSGEHLLSLINNVLDLSKFEVGATITELMAVSPHQILAEVGSLLRVPAIQKGLTLDYNWIGKIPRTIQTDPSKLRQLLINLVGNAVKFTEVGGVRVVAQILTAGPEPLLQIQVIDTGIGIPGDKHEVVFDPFSQADVSMTRRFGGTGLGLAISRRIAKSLGGTLTVDSSPGRGSTFTATVAAGSLDRVELRQSPPLSDIIPVYDPAASEPRRELPFGKRILLVEDSELNRRLVHRILERRGLTDIVDAVDGQVGVDLATAGDFDLILMDMQMPVKDGYAAATELRARGLTIPIIALTAHALAEDEAKCRRAGCSDYLTKPIDANRLVNKLAETLAERMSHCPIPHAAPPFVRCRLALDDPEFREVVKEFSAKLKQRLEEMKLAFAADDWDSLIQHAHWLAMSAAVYEQLTIPAARLERLARQHNSDAIEDLLRELDHLSKAIAEELSVAAEHSEAAMATA